MEIMEILPVITLSIVMCLAAIVIVLQRIHWILNDMYKVMKATYEEDFPFQNKIGEPKH